MRQQFIMMTIVGLVVAACGGAERGDGATAPTTIEATERRRGSGPPESPPTLGTAPTTTMEYPRKTNLIDVEDGTPESTADLYDRSDLVVVGHVRTADTLGRPGLLEGDTLASEYLAIDVAVDKTIKGASTDAVVLGWEAFQIGPDDQRVATYLANGVRPPRVGDRLLLFLIDADPAFVEWLGGKPTHQPTQLDGVAVVNSEGMVVHAEGGSPLGRAGSLQQVRAEIGG